MAYPDDLLEQATHLLRREPKRPKQASLRRAISSSYYALFHLLITEAVKNWKRPKERLTLARMFEHDNMQRVSAKKRDELRNWIQENPTSMANKRHLLNIVDTFVDMQHQRHIADYNGSKKWSRVEAKDRIDSVSEAFASWDIIAQESETQEFLVSLLLRDRRR
jgi:uncharacterized protein (UPF0332 family)